MDDGSEAEFGPGDVGSIPPGHDAWIIGDEPFMSIDFGDALYAKPPWGSTGSKAVLIRALCDFQKARI